MIEIGSQKQLFLDDYLIESMTGVQRTLNPATKAQNNPVIRPDCPWEGNNLHYGCVFYDEEQELFRMWYTASTVTPSKTVRLFTQPDAGLTAAPLEQEKPNSTEPILCYATSTDGYSWEKPSLGLVKFNGSWENNILKPENWVQAKGGIFVDPNEKDPTKRYKVLSQRTEYGAEGKLEFSWNLYTSPDAFNWTPYENNPVIQQGGFPKVRTRGVYGQKIQFDASGAKQVVDVEDREQSYLWGPTAFMGWDNIRGRYAVHMENCQHKRGPLGKRVIGRAESPDLIHWTPPQTIIIPDAEDPPGLQFYSMWATTYEGFYIGMLWNFLREERLFIWPQFVFSRDGIHYDRRFREPFIPLSPEPDYDSVAIYAQQPIVHDEKVFIFYNGMNFRERRLAEIDGPGPTGALGLAVTPLDGFVSLDNTLDASNRYGEVVTRPFRFSGNELRVNMGAVSEKTGHSASTCDVKVEILHPDHFPIVGFSVGDADSLTETGIANRVTWRGNGDLHALQGEYIKLKFYLKNAKLFAFQFMET